MPDKILPKFVAYHQQDFAASARMNRRFTWLQRHIYRQLSFTGIGHSRAACPPVNGAATLILRHATVSFFPSSLRISPSEEISNR
jgi:hypothetical protein